MATQTGEDEGVAKFRELVTNLTRTVKDMKDHNETLETESGALAELEDTTEDKIEDVEDKLEKAQGELQTAHDDAVEEIDDVVAAARAGVSDTLSDVVKDIDAAEERFKGAAQEAESELDQEHTELSEQGFSGLEADLDVVEEVLKRSNTEMDGSGDAFEQAVGDDGAEVDRELGDTEAKVDEAVGETRREQEEVETQAREDGESFADMGSAFLQACDTLFGEMATSYAGLDGEVQEDAKGLVQSIRNSVKAEAEALQTATGTHLEEPVGAFIDPNAPTYLAQVDVAEAATRGVIATGTELEKTVDNLLVCKDVCEVIKEALAELG